MSSQPLQTFIHQSSEKGLSSVTTLIVGTKSAILIDPPFLIPDALSVVSWIKKTTTLPLHAVFVTHHPPDHYFSANPILEVFPCSHFYAAPYVRAGIDREYDEKVKFWPTVFGKENVPEKPRKPDPYPYSFCLLDGNPTSPIMLLGPVQGDAVDHTMFWLPSEKTIVVGDAMYGRSTHLWYVTSPDFCDQKNAAIQLTPHRAEEIETPQILQAWQNVRFPPLAPLQTLTDTGHHPYRESRPYQNHRRAS